MKLLKIPLRKALNPVYRKQQLLREEMEDFKGHLRTLLERINTDETEENAKGHLTAFLNNTYYQGEYLIATKGRADMVIHSQKKASSNPAVLFEVKRPRDKGQTVPEMMRPDKGNVKALHELILYFLRERIEHHNTDLKYLIITDIHQWFVFDAADFERLFYKNRQLVKDYKDWRDGRKTSSNTDFFYQDIAQPMVANITEEVPCTQFDLRDYAKYANNDDPKDDKKLIGLYKILSPAHLLRLPFTNDSNSLNKDFYYELLHLIGLEETKIKNKKVIQRKPEGHRDRGSLLENAIHILERDDRLRRVPKLSSYGNSRNEQLFGVALELCITWVNRILFLKLLEAQLLKYHEGDRSYRFIKQELIKDYDELNELFFDALAKRKADRPEEVADKFPKVPYLNSSLFEISEMEDVTIRISSMKNSLALPLYSRTVLKDEKGKRLTGEREVLNYLFTFLDAYDFSSEGSESIQEENKNLINASVLGLIFEKINGYQDGAFFTPGFITMYMCRETLRRATVQKFWESDHFAEFDSEDFGDLQNYLSRKYAAADLQAANACINSLKICDPAVGSGHFLVSALNELLTIKSELGILCDRQGKPLAVRLEVANDELSIQWRHNDDFYEYQPGVHDNHLVQEALFYEKQNLIENCLFGVDLNPNSVKICRLRLWIELLKNAYYRKDGELETLPNIDINIKQGNSLVSRFALDADLSKVLKSIKYDIRAYQGFVRDYHRATDKEEKRGLLLLIDSIKSDFRSEIGRSDPKVKRLQRLGNQLYEKYQTDQLFEVSLTAAQKKDKKKLEAQIEKLTTEISDIKDAVIYRDAFEWRFEFPEVLDGKGNFVGFDVVIGNPPYVFGGNKGITKEHKLYFMNNYEVGEGKINLFTLFIEKACSILNSNQGEFSFIIPNTLLRVTSYDNTRRFILNNMKLRTVFDFGDHVFEDAVTTAIVINASKLLTIPQSHEIEIISPLGNHALDSSYIKENGYLIPTNIRPKDLSILSKLSMDSVLLGDLCQEMIFGVVISGNREEVVSEKEIDGWKPFVEGKDIGRYFINPSIHYLNYDPNKLHRPRTKEIFEVDEKILIQRITGGDQPLKAAYDNQRLYNKESINNIILKDKYRKETKFILALINSRLINWFYSVQFSNKSNLTVNLSKAYLSKIPIRVVGDDSKVRLTLLVEKIQELRPKQQDTTALKAEIDLLVYHLYELTFEEVLLVDPEFELTEEEYNNAKP